MTTPFFHQLEAIQEQARSGQVTQALKRLRDLILVYPTDVQLWQLYAELATDPVDLRFALENILELKPDDRLARTRLAALPLEQTEPNKALPGIPIQVKGQPDGNDKPTARLTLRLMQRFGYKRGDLIWLRGQDGTKLPVVVEEAIESGANDDMLLLNTQAQYLLNVQAGNQIALLPHETLIMLVDTSASMGIRLHLGKSRLAGTKGAINLLLDRKAHEGDDRVGLIHFDTNSHLLVLPTIQYDEVRAAVKKMQLGGATDLQGGLLHALRVLRSEAGLKRVILLTDGVPSTSTDDAILAAAHLAKKEKVIIDTIGLGRPGQREYNEFLLRSIAEITGGEFRQVEDLKALEQTFTQLAVEKRYLLTD